LNLVVFCFIFLRKGKPVVEKKAKLLLFVSSLIILYTEIVGANINFSLTYIPIIIFVLSLIIL